MNNDLDFEEKLLIEKYLTLVKMLLEMAEDYLAGKTTEIDLRLADEIMKVQNEIFSRLAF